MEEIGADLRRGLAVLASVGSVAPFVGLLGTVVGIISAFQGIASTGSGGLSSVSAGISEALIETALGLAVAIPAVLAFNYLTNEITRDEGALNRSAGELLDTIEDWAEREAHGGAGVTRSPERRRRRRRLERGLRTRGAAASTSVGVRRTSTSRRWSTSCSCCSSSSWWWRRAWTRTCRSSCPGIFNPDPEVETAIDPLKVTVAKAGEYYIDEQKYDLDGAIDALAAEHAAEPLRRLVLRADAKLTYGDVREILSRSQQVGLPGHVAHGRRAPPRRRRRPPRTRRTPPIRRADRRADPWR